MLAELPEETGSGIEGNEDSRCGSNFAGPGGLKKVKDWSEKNTPSDTGEPGESPEETAHEEKLEAGAWCRRLVRRGDRKEKGESGKREDTGQDPEVGGGINPPGSPQKSGRNGAKEQGGKETETEMTGSGKDEASLPGDEEIAGKGEDGNGGKGKATDGKEGDVGTSSPKTGHRIEKGDYKKGEGQKSRHDSTPDSPHFRAREGGLPLQFSFLRVLVCAASPEGGKAGRKGGIVQLFGTDPVFDRNPVLGKKAGIEETLGGNAGPVAAAAERFGNGVDEADLGAAPGVAEASRGLLSRPISGGLKVPVAAQELEDLRAGDDRFTVPAVGLADIHVLDEAEGEAGAAAAGGQRQDLVLIDPALENRVDLDEETALGGLEEVAPDSLGINRTTGHAGRDFRIEGIKADVDPVEPGRGESFGACAEAAAIGCHGKVKTGITITQLPDEDGQVPAKQGFAPGDADSPDTEVKKGAGKAGDLFEGEDFLPRKKAEIRTEEFSREAVLAAEVAAVSDGDTQGAEGTAEAVGGCRCGIQRGNSFPRAQPHSEGSTQTSVPSA